MLNTIMSERFWFMEPGYLKGFLKYVQSREITNSMKMEALETQKSTSQFKPYKTENDIAVIDIKGPLLKRVPWVLSFLFGIQSMESIGAAFNTALDDKDVDGIFLDIDSPGSEVDGVQTLSDTIFKGRGKKPVLSFIDGSGTSGAYWIGGSADYIALADQTTRVGSIGVVGVHQEVSEMAKKEGIGIHIFSSGTFKKAGNPYEKLSSKDIKYIDSQFTYLHNLFIDGVAKNLGISKNKIPSDVKEAKIFIGAQGIKAGLAHGIMNRGQALNKLRSMTRTRSTSYQSQTKAKDSKMYENHQLIDFVREITMIKDLDELRETEKQMNAECKRRESAASNWVEERDTKNLKDSVSKLVQQQRLLIHGSSRAQKVRDEMDLGGNIARSIYPNRCKG